MPQLGARIWMNLFRYAAGMAGGDDSGGGGGGSL